MRGGLAGESVKRRVSVRSGEGQGRGRRDRADSRRGGEALAQAAIECDRAGQVGPRGGHSGNVDHCEPTRIDAEVDPLQLAQLRTSRPAPENRTTATATWPTISASWSRRFADVPVAPRCDPREGVERGESRDPQGRDEAESQGRDDRGEKRKCECSPIDGHVAQPGEIGGRSVYQHPDGGVREQRPGDRRGGREHRVLDADLTHEPAPPSRGRRGPRVPGARASLNQKQSGGVRERDQEHQGNRTRESRDCRPHIAEDPIEQRLCGPDLPAAARWR